MQVAQILSDLTSLQLCETAAATALVRARPRDPGADSTQQQQQRSSSSTAAATTTRLPAHDADDRDLTRFQDLFELHSSVKVAHQDGTARELEEARRAVARVLREL